MTVVRDESQNAAGQEMSRNKEIEKNVYALFLRSSRRRKSKRYTQDQNHSIVG